MGEYQDFIALNDMRDDGGFRIDNDQKAEWALKAIREAEQERQRIQDTCRAEIERLQDSFDRAETRCERETAFLRGELMRYMDTVNAKDTKTQKSYRLPSGRLVWRKPKQDLDVDRETVLEWARRTNRREVIKTKEDLDWAGLKKTLMVDGEDVLTADGEIVPGVRPVWDNGNFKVEVDE